MLRSKIKTSKTYDFSLHLVDFSLLFDILIDFFPEDKRKIFVLKRIFFKHIKVRFGTNKLYYF